MALKDSFNKQNYNFSKLSETTLHVRNNSDGISYRFDYALRLLTVQYGEGISVQPFDRLDRETLIELRDKLVELGGKPPELPAEAPASPPSHKLRP